MLKTFRKKGVRKKILWGITVIIILSFGVFGNAYLAQNKREGTNYAGKVFGRVVSREEFENRLQETKILSHMKYGEKFYKLQQYLNLDTETWDRIILLEEAKKARIRVSDDDIISMVENTKAFQEDGRFSKERYANYVRYQLNVPPRNFEEIMRETLITVRLIQKETQAFSVTDDEVLNAYKLKNEKVQVSHVLFSADDYKDRVTFNETAAKEYYQAHKDDFLSPTTVNVEYIVITKNDSKKPAHDKTSPEDSAIPSETSKDKADRLAEKLNAGALLSEIAKENDLTVQESGLFSMEQPSLKTGWPFTLIQQIFETETGKILGPVETAQGWQVLRIKEKKDATIPDYSLVKDKVKDAWIKNEAKKFAKQKAEETLQTIRQKVEGLRQPDFVKIAKELNLKLEQTPLFTRGQYLPTIGISKDFQDAAFSLTEENKISGVVETVKGYSILNLDATVAADKEEFQKQKDQIKQTLEGEKTTAVYNDYLTRLRLKANLEDNIAKLRVRQKSY